MHAEYTTIDLFAGGGGASLGIQRALGVAPVVAINHNPAAIKMHAANHPGTLHLCESVFDVRPFRPGGRDIDLLWLSPDCTHFSRAKGGKPLDNDRRGLAWVGLEWAYGVRPRVIALENVSEFEDWGPLYAADHPVKKLRNKPIKERKGETFRRFVAQLESLGYVVEWRNLVACDYGAPTTRRRFFLIARCDGRPIVWPEPTHGPGRRKPWRTAAECVDWSIPALSIFATHEEAKAWSASLGGPRAGFGVPKRPLAEATQRRIAEGLRRYLLECADPYIAPFVMRNNTNNQATGLHEPVGTVTTGNRHYLCTPYVAQTSHQGGGDGSKVREVDAPLSTVVTKAEHLLVSPSLIQTGYGERAGQRPRALDLQRPLGTVVAGGSKHALIAAWLAKHNGSGSRWNAAVGSPMDGPVHTVTSRDNKAVLHAHLSKFYGTAAAGQTLDAPAPTVTAGGGRGGGHAGLVAAFLTKFYGAESGQNQALSDPLHTIVKKARFGLVTVNLGGTEYAITDIAMRMLQPRELARAQGFHDDYILTGNKSEKTARIGNSVPPDVVEAIVRAQFGAPDSDYARKAA